MDRAKRVVTGVPAFLLALTAICLAVDAALAANTGSPEIYVGVAIIGFE